MTDLPSDLPVAFVLLSGGIDSSTCLYLAHLEFKGNVVGISIDYGQRHRNEIAAAKQICEVLGVRHRVLAIPQLIPATMLTDEETEIPQVSYSEIKGISPTYVPFRNGLMLSAVTAYAYGQRGGMLSPEWGIYFGAHFEDARNWAYPDCTPEFIGAMANAIYVGTYRAIRLHTPLQWLNKPAVITLGESLNVPWALTRSCYTGNENHCGTCPTCRARRDGFMLAGVRDPTTYQNTPVVQEA